MTRGFIEIDAVIALAILVATLFVLLSVVTLSIQELKDKIEVVKLVQESITQCMVKIDGTCLNDFIP